MNNDEERPFKLNIQIKGDKLLYYKRKFTKFEQTIEIYKYWASVWVWIYIVFSLETLFFIVNISMANIKYLPSKLNFFLFKESTILYPQNYLYTYAFFTACIFLITLGISYKLYYGRKPLSYLMLIISSICILLVFISLCKFIQMRLSLFY